MGTLEETLDLALDGDMQPHAPAAAGITAVGLRLKHRLTTRRGTFPWARQFGTDLRQYILSKTPAWRIAKDAEIEIRKDEQVDGASIGLEILDNGRRIRLQGVVVCSTVKSFTFTMDITQAAGTLVALREAA